MNQQKTRNARDIVNQAQVSHFTLGLQLRAAAYDENQGLNPRVFKRTDNCELAGLLRTLKENGEMTDRSKQVEMLHIDLHEAASAIASLIVAGQFDEAIAELATGYYSDAAAALSKSLCYFKAEVA